MKMKDLLKKAIPTAALALFAGAAFAGTPGALMPQGSTVSGTVLQADEPTPEFCKKNPADPRCKK
jgi:hypothetical protein